MILLIRRYKNQRFLTFVKKNNMSKINRSTSESLFKTATTYFPGGVNSPVRAFKSVEGAPIFIKKGDGLPHLG